LISNGAIQGTTIQGSGTATVNALISNSTVSGTGAYFTSVQSSGTATVNALISNGAIQGTTIQGSGTATVNALVSNTTVSGTGAYFTSVQSSGTATVNAVSSNTSVTGNTFVLSGTMDQSIIYTSSTAAQQTIDSFAIASYRAAEYQISLSSGSSYEITKVTVIHDGTTPNVIEYDSATTNGWLASFDASIVTGTLNFQATPVNAATTFRIYRKLWNV
jgi:hypothetical protein